VTSPRQIRTFEQRRLDPEERRYNQRMLISIAVAALMVALTCGLVVDYLIRAVNATEVRSSVARLVRMLPSTRMLGCRAFARLCSSLPPHSLSPAS
jgi:hypothetical protein